MKHIKGFDSFKIEESLDQKEVLNILDAAAMFADDAEVAANQTWKNRKDLISYLLSDHIPRKDHKSFKKYVGESSLDSEITVVDEGVWAMDKSKINPFIKDLEGADNASDIKKIQKKYWKLVGDDRLMDSLDKAIKAKDISSDEFQDNVADAIGRLRDFMNESVVNEAISVTGKRDAKKVMNTYIKFFEKYPALSKKALGVPVVHHLGAVKRLYSLAMEDANFGREGAATANQIKGRIFPVEVKVPDLNNAEIKIPNSKLLSIIQDNASAISGAAKFSGLGIVEGTAMYLDSIGQSTYAQALLDAFNNQ